MLSNAFHTGLGQIIVLPLVNITEKAYSAYTRLSSRQSRCISSDSMAHPDGRGKVGMPEILYKNVIECSVELTSKTFVSAFTLKQVVIFYAVKMAGKADRSLARKATFPAGTLCEYT